MNTYIILPNASPDFTSPRFEELKQFGTVTIIAHKGKIAELTQLQEDPEDKIIGIDPDVVDWDLDVDAFDHIPNVKAVCVDSTGFTWIHPDELKQKGIMAINSPKFSTDSVAEYAISLAITGARRLAVAMKNDNKIDWDHSPMMLKGKTFGIIGLGTIGKRIAELAQGIGMHVIYWSRSTRDDRFTYMELDEVFRTADVILPIFATNEETKILITNERLDMLKSNAIFVGITALEPILDMEYLLQKVANNTIGGLSFEADTAKPLSAYEGNVWATPAIAWFSQDSINNLLNIWIDGMIAMAKGEPIHIVN